MKQVATTAAVGHILCHDLTRIIPGVSKDAAFRKGHVIQVEDIPVLLSMGKEHLFVWDLGDDMLHENDAAEILHRICGSENMLPSAVKEGKIELRAEIDGLFTVDVERLNQLNDLDFICIATRSSGFPVQKGDRLGGFRIIPLAIEREKMRRAEDIGAGNPVFRLLPFKPFSVGLITTGSELYHGRIQDKFGPVIKRKMAEFGGDVVTQTICDDKLEDISCAISALLEQGVDMIVCTGGMSVDPDDLTPGAIAASCTEVISYGSPVLPGAMFMLGYHKDTPIMGLPGCVMFEGRTVFDIILPRLAAGCKVSRREIRSLGNGGLCLGCSPCTYPNCGFGKGTIYA